MKNKIVKGTTQQFYYDIPSDLDRIAISPNKEAISKFLAQISFRQFPEFVMDILVNVFHHTKVDITDGQGDEQQDILTIDPEGFPCLTQCKHTEKTKGHYNGTDLDNMVTVCLRKNCKKALFVTNGDITPQGKKYITDREYNRLVEQYGFSLDIDYWNDFKIWDLVKNNSAILNKWFSGMGQTSALRTFKFNVFVQKLPYDNEENLELPCAKLIEFMIKDKVLQPMDSKKSDAYVGTLDNSIHLKVTHWFQHSNDLDINYILPQNSQISPDRLMNALSIEVTVGHEPYQPEKVRDRVIEYLFTSLPRVENGDSNWWHITAAACKSFIFIHDIGIPREITLCSAKTFVKLNQKKVTGELEHCSFSSLSFRVKYPEEDNAMWTHSSGLDVFQIFEQRQHPVQLFNQQLRHLNRIKNYRSYDFFSATKIDIDLQNRIRNIIPEEWVAIIQNEDTILWGIPPQTNSKLIDKINNQLLAINVKISKVDKESKEKVFKSLSEDILPNEASYYVSDVESLSYPVNLKERFVGIMADVQIKNNNINKALELLKYKYTLENVEGFTHLARTNRLLTHTSEIPNLLADVHTFRGKIMLDVGVRSNPWHVYLRFHNDSIDTSEKNAANFINKAKIILKDIKQLAQGKSINTTTLFNHQPL